MLNIDEVNKNNNVLNNNKNNKRENDENLSSININQDSENENEDSNEKAPLINHQRLMIILNDMNKLKSNKEKEIEEKYEDYDGDDDNKKK